MSSTRLPGKVLADVAGEPMLALMLRRLEAVRGVAQRIVATSVEAIDDPVAELAAASGMAVARGPRDDVLARFIQAIGDHDGPVVRLTADCPLIDPEVVDAAVALFERTPGCAYASNVEPRTFPVGLDVEVVSAAVLREIDAEPRSPEEREHVTIFVRRRPDRFPHASLTREPDLSGLRWTVDDGADLEFVRAVVARLGDRRHIAGLDEVLAAVREEPALMSGDGRARG